MKACCKTEKLRDQNISGVITVVEIDPFFDYIIFHVCRRCGRKLMVLALKRFTLENEYIS